MRISDWSSDVCSSDLPVGMPRRAALNRAVQPLGVDFGLNGLFVGHDIRPFFDHDANRRGPVIRLSPEFQLSAFLIPSAIVKPAIAAISTAAVGQRSEEQKSELPSPMRITYDVFSWK